MTNYRQIVKYAILVLFLTLFAWFVYWLSNQSRITVLLPNGITGATAVVISEDSTINLSLEASQTTVRVPKNTYSILVSSGDESFFSVVKTKSFLSTVEVAANVKPQKQRVFVGDDPGSCMNYFNNNLVSYGCSGQLYDMKLHIPSTERVPTYTKSVKAVLNSVSREADQSLLASIGEIEGVIENEDTLYVLAKQPFIEGKEILSHILYSITPTANSINFRFIERLNILTPENNYKMAGTIDNLYIYNSNDYSELYVGTINDIQRIDVSDGLTPESYEPFILLKNNDTFIRVYREVPEMVEDYGNNSLSTVVFVGDKQITINELLTDIQACGSGYCALNDRSEVRVYSTEFSEQLSIPGVQNFNSNKSNDSLFLTFSNNVVEFSLTTLEGLSLFNYEGFDFVSYGLSDSNNPVVTIRSSFRSHVVSLQESDLTEQIEDVITGLTDKSVINTVSLNKNNLFISPELGNLDYYDGSDSLDYNPIVKTVVGNTIKDKLSNLNTYGLKVVINNITN